MSNPPGNPPGDTPGNLPSNPQGNAPSNPPGNPPPIVPPALNYGQMSSRPSGKNRWWMVLLRVAAGMAAGVASCAVGWGLVLATDEKFPPIFFLPPALLLSAAIVIALYFRRYGYVTGILLAPLVIGFGLVVLLLIICGSLAAPGIK